MSAIVCGSCDAPVNLEAEWCEHCHEWFEECGTVELHEEEDKEDFNAAASVLVVREVEQ